jgi:hypothetical protein
MKLGECPVCGRPSGLEIFCSQSCAAAAGKAYDLTLEMIAFAIRWIAAPAPVWRERLQVLALVNLLTIAALGNTDPAPLAAFCIASVVFFAAAFALVTRAERALTLKGLSS